MTPLVPLIMFGFVPFGLQMFKRHPARVAVATIFVVGWVLLPQAKYDIPVLPDYTKGNALGMATLIGLLATDRQVLAQFRFSPIDLPVLAWCLAPFFSSVTNGLGAWDGMSAALGHTVEWGLPYLLGRLYFGDPDALRILAIAMFLGGLVMIPFALVEMVISPQMHILFYGWYPHDFSQTKRYGGWRPSVFMEHGLEFAMWMAAATFMGWQLWLRKILRGRVPLLKLPLFPALLGLTLTFAMCRSAGALMLFIGAMAVLVVAYRFRTRLPILLLLLLPVLYMNVRATGAWDGQNLIEAAGRLTGSEERAGSLSYRLYNETLLVEKARERWWFGWAGYKRSFVTDEQGRFISVPDGMWILTLGKNGIFGLTALTFTILLAPFLYIWRLPRDWWGEAQWAAGVAFAIFLGIFMTDNLLNAMYNPIMMLGAGGLAAWVASGQREVSASEVRVEREPLEPVTRVI